jgi:two-component system C4-dicarboxylate transport sensor histidine kinase DctB
MSVADQEELFGPARTRLESRLATGLAIAAVPLALLVLLLRRSLRIFRRAEREAVHEEELRRLGEASNLIAHEVKNALNGIRLGVDLAVAGDPARPRHSDAVIALRQEIGRLAEFTGDLLNVAKGIAPRPVPMDLADLVRKVADLQGGMAADLGVDLGVVAPVPVAVRADPSLVHSIIANLVGNALDALAGTAASHRSVRIDVRTASGLAVVDVTDDGPGVALAVKARLFEPFVTGKPSGTGIGLALSRKIARAHGGDLVLVEGSPKTCFRLTLPVGGEGTAR